MTSKGACIVTGASQGIGRATAIALAAKREYSSIVLVSRNLEKLEETKALAGNPDNMFALPFDLEELEGIPAMVSSVVRDYGDIDLLVNVSGYADPKPLFETDAHSLEKTFRVNVFALTLMCREVAKNMRGHRCGKIINIASTAGSTPRPGWISYSSSKAAVISISQTLTAELAEYGVKVYCVSPGRCATDLRRKLAPEEDPATIMQPEQVAEIIDNLSGDTGNALDGQDIVVRYQPRL
ncbi:3-oxoacyl-ACP reductase [Gordonibacter sp. 28C]|uniref:SDR family NAD(P)-dependent oxidoreductase n=1 Tax=Gordonibacter sp. 28C TaxID=2078569 RepID=UPI000DF7CAA2|nr:SDR family oxidoreductase [Gordonibacter sp. 28C]RDB60543.1 3-oxoacyl-ACP reductase [Gordonibacter sp. 28C]